MRGVCLFINALAVAGRVDQFPGETGTAIQYAALILLGAHALEVLIAFKSVRLYRGTRLVSVLLTVLFGFLHWLPSTGKRPAGSGDWAAERRRRGFDPKPLLLLLQKAATPASGFVPEFG